MKSYQTDSESFGKPTTISINLADNKNPGYLYFNMNGKAYVRKIKLLSDKKDQDQQSYQSKIKISPMVKKKKKLMVHKNFYLCYKKEEEEMEKSRAIQEKIINPMTQSESFKNYLRPIAIRKEPQKELSIATKSDISKSYGQSINGSIMEVKKEEASKMFKQAALVFRPDLTDYSLLWKAYKKKKQENDESDQEAKKIKKIKKLKGQVDVLLWDQFYKSLYTCPNGSGECRANFCCCGSSRKKIIRKNGKRGNNLKEQSLYTARPPSNAIINTVKEKPYSYEIAIPKCIRPSNDTGPLIKNQK